MNFRAIVTSLTLLMGAPVTAQGVLYDCAVTQTSGPKGWISTRLGLIIDDKGAGRIIDSLTLHFETGPRPVTIRRRGQDLRLRWSFSALSDKSSQIIPTFSYSATLNTQSGAFKIRGKPVRFPQSVSGKGTCVTRKNLSRKDLNRLLRG